MKISSEKIKIIRKKLNLKQTEFGERLGVKGCAVSSWEKELSQFPESKVRLLISAFNIRIEWLETGEGEMFETPKQPEITPFDYAKSVECTDLVANIFSGYCSLSKEDKIRFSELLDQILTNVSQNSFVDNLHS